MANKFGIDTDALIAQYENATSQQGAALRKAVQAATLQALQQRELTLKAIKEVVKVVSQAASAGAARNVQGADVEALLEQTVAGIDGAVQQAVQASQRAMQQLLDQGVDLRETQMKKALTDIEKMEDMVFDTLRKATSGEVPAPVQQAWGEALKLFGQGDSATGKAANTAVESLIAQAQAMSREGRAFNQRAAQAFMDHYATLVSGVLIGMSEALSSTPAAKPAPAARKSR
ncbi:DUF6781 family protein [Pseudorhodoferax sp. Leaf267]|uniref:DUF6781 family protein n=1 Tax=Pseudorhodoferax sp. Leaf267 TaxID=1736316 RepID=UPI0006F22E59|nr:DUF6781 family protein [Pseudorhodoferax sp. Leaf267]KQP19755.1 hypothetical protein ASF43_28380 [Pseudorhodoferax sp. Leaf267]